MSPFGLVAVFASSLNQAIPDADCVTASGPLFSDAPTEKKTMPPRGTRLTSQGDALMALVALIVYVMLIQPEASAA